MKPSLIFTILTLSMVLPNLAFAESGTSQVEVNGQTHEVSYDATGLIVDGMEADTLLSTLTITIETSDVSPILTVTLDRSFFDSKTDGADDDFLILADSEEAAFEEEKTDLQRIFTITVPSGASSIDIIAPLGTSSFGSAEEIPEEAPEETPVKTPEEIPEEETPVEEPETPQEEPEMQCGPGTILKDGVCVLAEAELPTESPEEPQVSEDEMQCGPGTILKDGICVLDETCGPGTILKEGVCVLDESTPAQPSTSRWAAFDLVAPAVAAFVIAFIIMIILWAIGRASRKKNG